MSLNRSDKMLKPDVKPGGHPTLKNSMGTKCGNPECNVSNIEVTLKSCSRCKQMRYCSQESQRAHWHKHKPICNNQIHHAAGLAQADAIGLNFFVPGGLTFSEPDQKLEKWVNFHSRLLMAATFHALEVPRDITRCRTHVFRVQVSYREDNGGSNAKAFRLVDASAIDVNSAMAFGGAWPQGITQITTMREESKAKGQGTVTALALECVPLAMQIVPFASIRDIGYLEIQPHWKEIMRRQIESGRKPARFQLHF